MGRLVLRRLLSGVLLFFALTLVTFIVYYKIPADPGQYLAPPGSTPAQWKAIDHRLGVDRPVVVQYGKYVWRIVRHGDLGASWDRGVSVKRTIRSAGFVTLSLVVGGAIVLLLLAFPLALLSALRAQTFVDRAVLLFSILGIALHPFVVGALLRGFFSGDLHLLPRGVYCPLHGTALDYIPGPNGTPFGAKLPTCGGVVDWTSHLVLPWLTFACFFLPLYTRMIRARLLETLGEPFVLTARAKGASELLILRKHVLKNALLPIITMLAMDMGTALTAAIYVEAVFGLPGLGYTAVNAISGESVYDLPVILGIVFVVALSIVALTLVADLVYGLVDPRIRVSPER